jgi:hypothetical protein
MSQYFGTGRFGTHQSVSYSTSAGTISTAIGTGVQKVRLVVTTASFVFVGSTGAATSDVYMPADSPEYITISPGQKVSAIQSAASGTLHVTEIP